MYADVIIIKNIETPLERLLCANSRSSLFKEHFKDFPILPGAFGIGLCVDTLLEHINKNHGEKYIVDEIKKSNFLKPIEPNSILKISVIKEVKNNERVTIIFSLNDGQGMRYMSGMIIFKEAL